MYSLSVNDVLVMTFLKSIESQRICVPLISILVYEITFELFVDNDIRINRILGPFCRYLAHLP